VLKLRDHTIDVLRGMAIFAMIAANMAAHNYQEPHPFSFRLFGSFAAPLFVFLAGFMVSTNAGKKHYGILYFLEKAFITLLVAVALDMACWRIIPFTTFDVLYVIGLSCPLVFLLSKLNRWLHLSLTLIFFIATPLIHFKFGYKTEVVEVSLGAEDIWKALSVYPFWSHLFVDGWFPVFPWMGVALFGGFVGRLRMENTVEKGNRLFLVAGMLMLLAGIITWSIQKPDLLVREGYSELFYPPTTGYFLVYLGLDLILLALLYKVKDNLLLLFFVVYGRSSMFMYILQGVFIAAVFNVFIGALPFHKFLQLYLFHAFFLWWIALAAKLLKDQIRKLPLVFRVVFGG
jgi:uncharacterized membrane protein